MRVSKLEKWPLAIILYMLIAEFTSGDNIICLDLSGHHVDIAVTL